MNETKTYLSTEQVIVTNDILIINSWRFHMRDINAIFVTRQATYRRYPICAAILFFIIGAAAKSVIMAIPVLLLVLIALLMKTNYQLRIKLYSGENRPLTSTNRQELENIKRAVEIALLDFTSNERK